MTTQTVLPCYSLYIRPQNLKKLNHDIWSSENVLGKLKKENIETIVNVSYRGYLIRKYKKKSFHILFEKPQLVNGAREIHLNAEYKDFSLIRNKLSLDFFSSIGVLTPKSQHVLLKLNGIIKGVYLELESLDECLLKKRSFPIGAIYYAVNDDANFSLLTPENNIKTSLLDGYTRKFGTEKDDKDLNELILFINTANQEDFNSKIQNHIDILQYLKWLAGVVCTQNFDGFINNYALIRNPSTNLFEMSPWDYDGTWGRDINGNILEQDYVPITGYNTLTARVLDCSAYRKLYYNVLGHILVKEFTTQYQQEKISQLYYLIRPYVLKDPYIKQNIDIFDNEPEVILEFISQRNKYLSHQLQSLV